MGNSIVTFFIFPKNFKKIQYLAFSNKVRIINSFLPEKVKNYIEKNLIDEIRYFQKNIRLMLKFFQMKDLLFQNTK